MPVMSASTCSQTGAVKKPRKGVISEMMIGRIGAAADEREERCWVIATVESSRGELSLMLFQIRLSTPESYCSGWPARKCSRDASGFF
jgi:hypothetical protein